MVFGIPFDDFFMKTTHTQVVSMCIHHGSSMCIFMKTTHTPDKCTAVAVNNTMPGQRIMKLRGCRYPSRLQHGDDDDDDEEE